MKKLLATFLMIAIVFAGVLFSQDTEAAWLDDAWLHRVKIEINPTYIDSTLSDFPVYIALSDLPTGAVDSMISGCGDIRVTTDDEETEVPREVVTCETTGDTGELYFKASSLSSSATTTFYIYYENSAVSDYAVTDTYGAQNVWTNSYGGVWHMGGGTLSDSTGNVGDSTTQTGDADTDTLTEGSATDYDGSERTIIPDDTDIDNDVLSSLTYWGLLENDTEVRAMEKSNQYFLLNFAGAGDMGPLMKISGTNKVASVGTLNTGQYYMLGGTYSYSGGSTGVINAILDGAYNGTNSGLTASIDSGGGDLYLGSDDTSNYYNGRIDEFRISKVVRTEAWLGATWDNLKSPDSFYYVGTEEDVPETVDNAPIYINYGAININNGGMVVD